MKKLKNHKLDYDIDNRNFTKKNKKSGWIKPKRSQDKQKLNRYLSMSTGNLDSDDYLDDEYKENYR